MHRSGTSALARSINILGPGISADLMTANDFNPTGYWEPQPVVRLDEKVLAHFQRHWADPKPFPKGWTQSAAMAKFADRARATLEADLPRSGSAVVKDPRLSRVLPLWTEALAARDGDPVYLIACRHPMEVAQSLARRDGLSIEHGLQLWLSYMLEAEAATRDARREVIHYEDLLQDWRQALAPVCRYPGLLNIAEIDGAQAAEVDSFLTPGARHHDASQSDFGTDQDIPDTVTRAHDLFRRFPETRDGSAFDALAAEWRAAWEALSPGDGASGYIDRMPETQIAKSKALEKKGRIADALDLARAASTALPDRAYFHFRVGLLSEKSGDLAAAAQAMRRAIARDDAPVGFHRGLARVLRKQGDPHQEAVALNAALVRHPKEAKLHHQLSACLKKTGDIDGAIAALRKAVSLDDTRIGVQLTLARTLGKHRGPEEEIAALHAACLRHTDDAPLHYALGTALEAAGTLPAAVQAMRRALKLDDEPVGHYWSLARVLRKHGDWDSEIAIWRAACNRHPENALLFHQLGECTELFGDRDRSGASFDAAARLDRRTLDRIANEGATPNQGEKEALIRTLAWQAAQHLARRAERLDAEPAGRDAPWPLGAARPARAAPPVIRPVAAGAAPLVSVMIPVYELQSPDWLRHCINSILGQPLDPDQFEIAVIDDASASTVAAEVAQACGPRVTYSRNEVNLGLSWNFNRCIERATGQFVHILHQDDWVAPGFYDALLAPMTADDRIVAAFSDCVIADETGRKKGLRRMIMPPGPTPGFLKDWLKTISIRQRISFPSIIVRRGAYEAAGGFSPDIAYSMDWDMWTRLAAQGPVWHDPRPLAHYRAHSGSETYRQHVLDRSVDCMQTALGNLPLLDAALRHPVLRAVCRHQLMQIGNFLIHPDREGGRSEETGQALDLLIRGQAGDGTAALARRIFLADKTPAPHHIGDLPK